MMRSGDTWSNGGFRTSPLLPSSSAARGAGGALRRLARLPLPVLAALLLGAAVVSFLLGQFLLPNTGEEGGPGGGGPARISLRQLQRATPSQAFCGALKARPKASRHQYPLVCAHGGDTARHAPNTLAAFRSAIEAGARCVEVDASLSLDAVPVAIHQREFRRMVGDASADVGFAKLDKITKLDAALGLSRSVSRANATVSTLKEVVLEIAPLVETLIVDVKTSNRHRNVKTAGGVSIVLRNARCANCVVWSKADSVTNNVMNSCREAGVVGGEVLLNDTAQAIREGMHRPFRLKAAGALAVHHAMLDEDLVERARQSGMRVFGWTANEPYMMRQVMASGADAVVTNEPQDFERAAEAWRQRCARKDERI